MCLGIPGEVIEIEGDKAVVSIGGVRYDAGLALSEDIAPGDYVIMHAGFVLQKIDPAEAQATLETIREYTNLDIPEAEITKER